MFRLTAVRNKQCFIKDGKITYTAGANVDKIAEDIILEYGFDKLTEIAKMNFKNVEQIKKQTN